MSPKVTIIIPISRPDYLAQVFAYLELMDCDNNNTNILAIVDGDSDLFVDARNRVTQSKFSNRLCVEYKPPTKDVPGEINPRRLRIADIHNQLKQYIGECDYIFGVEDDTLVPKYALKYLLEDLDLYPHAGFIEGVEIGRRHIPYVGAWKLDDIYEPTLIKSVVPNKENQMVVEIDAGGFYCFITSRDIYMSHIFQPYKNNILGPDVDFGTSLREFGYMNYLDWRINCIHRSGDKSLSFPKTPIRQAILKKQGIRWIEMSNNA
jgi:hypothetical protein